MGPGAGDDSGGVFSQEHVLLLQSEDAFQRPEGMQVINVSPGPIPRDSLGFPHSQSCPQAALTLAAPG